MQERGEDVVLDKGEGKGNEWARDGVRRGWVEGRTEPREGGRTGRKAERKFTELYFHLKLVRNTNFQSVNFEFMNSTAWAGRTVLCKVSTEEFQQWLFFLDR